MFKQILQLRTGYSKLNDYRHKLGQVETRFCECGEVENVQHFLLGCPLYEEARYILLNRLIEQLDIQDPSVYTLLSYDSHVELPNWRDLICEEIGQYIKRTERFKETQDQKLASQ